MCPASDASRVRDYLSRDCMAENKLGQANDDRRACTRRGKRLCDAEAAEVSRRAVALVGQGGQFEVQ